MLLLGDQPQLHGPMEAPHLLNLHPDLVDATEIESPV